MQSTRVTRILTTLTAAERITLINGLGAGLLTMAFAAWKGELSNDPLTAVMFEGSYIGLLTISLFILLALFKRLAFALAWLALIYLWIRGPMRWDAVGVMGGFVFWSTVALPFYLTCIAGFARPNFRGSLLTTPTTYVLGAWSCLLVAALAITPRQSFALLGATDGVWPYPSPTILAVAPYVWGVLPFVIALHSIARVVRVLRSEVADRGAYATKSS